MSKVLSASSASWCWSAWPGVAVARTLLCYARWQCSRWWPSRCEIPAAPASSPSWSGYAWRAVLLGLGLLYAWQLYKAEILYALAARSLGNPRLAIVLAMQSGEAFPLANRFTRAPAELVSTIPDGLEPVLAELGLRWSLKRDPYGSDILTNLALLKLAQNDVEGFVLLRRAGAAAPASYRLKQLLAMMVMP